MTIVTLHSMPDELLMERVAQGDKRAYEHLVRLHLPRAYAIARRVLPNTHDAEEAAQDAFTKLWVHAADWQPGKAKFTTWLYRIVVNAALDMARRKKLPTTNDEALLEMVEDGGAPVEAQLVAAQERASVNAAIATLTLAQRAAISLTYFEELTNPEAAKAMGIHVKALEGLLVRARKQLRTLLEKKETRHAA